MSGKPVAKRGFLDLSDAAMLTFMPAMARSSCSVRTVAVIEEFPKIGDPNIVP